jgi:hypothetical protein
MLVEAFANLEPLPEGAAPLPDGFVGLHAGFEPLPETPEPFPEGAEGLLEGELPLPEGLFAGAEPLPEGLDGAEPLPEGADPLPLERPLAVSFAKSFIFWKAEGLLPLPDIWTLSSGGAVGLPPFDAG